jgi:hypothetical protein
MGAIGEFVGQYSGLGVAMSVVGVVLAILGIVLFFKGFDAYDTGLVHGISAVCLLLAVFLTWSGAAGTFKRSTGESMIEFVNNMRLVYASNGYVSEEWQEIGFGNGQEFARNKEKAMDMDLVIARLKETEWKEIIKEKKIERGDYVVCPGCAKEILVECSCGESEDL